MCMTLYDTVMNAKGMSIYSKLIKSLPSMRTRPGLVWVGLIVDADVTVDQILLEYTVNRISASKFSHVQSPRSSRK